MRRMLISFHVPITSKSLEKTFFLLICDGDTIRFSQSPCLSLKKFNVLNYLVMELLNKRGTAGLRGREARIQALLDVRLLPPPCPSVSLSVSKVCDSPGTYFVLLFHAG